MSVWDNYLTARDRAVFAKSGHGMNIGFGVRPAVLVVDVTYDFVGHEPAYILDSMDAWYLSCGEAGWDSVDAIYTLLQAARLHRLPVFYTANFEPRSDGLGRGLQRSTRAGQRSAVGEFVGTDVVMEVAPRAGDVLIRKPKPSAFFGTPLLSLLLELGVDTLLIVGATTSGCVRASVVDAYSHNFRVGVIEEGTFDRGEASHAVNLFDMNAKYADVVGLQAALEYISGLQERSAVL